jgi:hypothetical protein
VPNCFASGIDFPLADCSDGTPAATGTASESVADFDADSSADIPAGGHA